MLLMASLTVSLYRDAEDADSLSLSQSLQALKQEQRRLEIGRKSPDAQLSQTLPSPGAVRDAREHMMQRRARHKSEYT